MAGSLDQATQPLTKRFPESLISCFARLRAMRGPQLEAEFTRVQTAIDGLEARRAPLLRERQQVSEYRGRAPKPSQSTIAAFLMPPPLALAQVWKRKLNRL